MTIKEIQFKFIAIHSVAACLMVLGARELFMLLHAVVVSIHGDGAQAEAVAAYVLHYPSTPLGQVPESYFHAIAAFGLMGLVTSILLSWIEARKREIPKMNVLLVGVLGFWLAKLITGSFFHLHHAIPSLHDVAAVLGPKILFLLNTLLLFSAALLLMLSKYLKRRPLKNL